MDALFDSYPVFEANQVLTSAHLNDVFDYLDQQTRLTRSRLVGIGIVCGFEISLDTGGTSIGITRGCGVTTEGYLISEPDDLSLTAYREYKLPEDLAYPQFMTGTGTGVHQFALWELFPSGIANTTSLAADATFLNDKAVLLFLELKKQGLRNCSPNNCDDKGSEVTATVRKLLVSKADLDQVLEAENALGSGLTPSDLDAAAVARLGLPDLRVSRFDVINTAPTTSNDVYAAFLNTFRPVKFVDATSKALRGAYQAFKPLLLSTWPTDPFENFKKTFGFLEGTPESASKVRFLQYYVGLFEDLVSAYDEFRWKGLDLLCACCPPDDLFPRHLALGLLHPESVGRPARYRQAFLPSPAGGCCSADTKALLQLFARLVEMVARFTNDPALAKPNDAARMDPQIRVTPSLHGDRPLGSKAIPFYYRLTGDRPLYRLWNVEKTLRNRSNQNLGYRFDEYQPAPPPFVSDPLRFDLEPYNFLRVEGHLGKDYRHVVESLLETKSQFRLPIDVIALRAGQYDENQPVDLTKESARFQDLEALYDSLREDLLSTLAAGAMELYEAPIPGERAAGTPNLPLLKNYLPNFRYPVNSLGAYYESRLQSLQALPYLEVDQTLFSDPRIGGEVLRIFCVLFFNELTLPAEFRAHVVSIFYFSKLAEVLPAKLDALGFADFANRYQDLIALVHYFRNEAAARTPKDLQTFLPDVELIDHFDNVLFSCKLEAIRSVHVEYVKRVAELRKRQFLSTFLQQHPGIQHKAGVSLGGTFILVYHGIPTPPIALTEVSILNTLLLAGVLNTPAPAPVSAGGSGGIRGVPRVALRESSSSALEMRAAAAPSTRELDIANIASKVLEPDAKTLRISDTINRISANKTLTENQDIASLIAVLTGKFQIDEKRPANDDSIAKIIASTVSALADGAVIADFFLPYRLVPDTVGAQFVLPKALPGFTAAAGCTSADGISAVTIKARGGDAPYDIAVDQGAYQALTGKTVSLAAGAHTLRIRDSAGTETEPTTITIPPPITTGPEVYDCQDGKYTVTFTVSGGTPPYTVNDKAVADGGTFTSELVASDTSITVDIVDSVLCSTKPSFTHTCPPPCDLPCAGAYVRRGYRMWLPDPEPNNPYAADFKIDVQAFSIQASADSAAGPGEIVDLADKMREALGSVTADLTMAGFAGTVKKWISVIHKVISGVPSLNKDTLRWLQFSYEPLGPGRLGQLSIDHFDCLNFDIKLVVTFTREVTRADALEMSYSPKGTDIRGRTVRASSVPAFEGFSINKCVATSERVNFCPARPPVVIEIVRESPAGTLEVALSVKPTPDNIDLQFFWEVQNAVPSITSGKNYKGKFIDANGGLVVVTAFTKEGCTVTTSQQISLR